MGHMLRAALVFIVGFYCCPWSSMRSHSYAKGVAVVFTDGCPSGVPAGLVRTPCLDLPQEQRKKNRNEVQRFNQTYYEIYTTHCPFEHETRRKGLSEHTLMK